MDDLTAQVKALHEQVFEANKFIAEKIPELEQHQALAEHAEEDTDKMIHGLQSLADKFSADSKIATDVHKAMNDIRKWIEQYRAGTPEERIAARKLQDALKSFE